MTTVKQAFLYVMIVRVIIPYLSEKAEEGHVRRHSPTSI